MKYCCKFYNMIKQAFFSFVDSDDSAYPIGQATSNRKSNKFTRLSTYGVCANPPRDSHVLLFNSQGQESNKFGILNDFINRKKNLLEGDVVLVNTITKSYVYLKSDISIEIKSDGLVKIISDSFEIESTGLVKIVSDSVKIESTGAVEVEASAVNITNSNVTVTGGDVIADGISLKTHFHQGNLGFPVGMPIQSGGGTPPSTPPSSNGSGDLITGNGISLDAHTHPTTGTATAVQSGPGTAPVTGTTGVPV